MIREGIFEIFPYASRSGTVKRGFVSMRAPIAGTIPPEKAVAPRKRDLEYRPTLRSPAETTSLRALTALILSPIQGIRSSSCAKIRSRPRLSELKIFVIALSLSRRPPLSMSFVSQSFSIWRYSRSLSEYFPSRALSQGMFSFPRASIDERRSLTSASALLVV